MDSVFLYCATRREGQCATENGNCLFCASSAITYEMKKRWATTGRETAMTVFAAAEIRL